jgi:hypothetical protein
MFVCNKCFEKPAEGGTLRYCQRCKVRYCSVECQRADWDSHKPLCKDIRENKRLREEKKRARGAGGKKNLTALQEWYSYTLPRSVRIEVIALAWQHRALHPVIEVATSPDGADAHAPRLTVGAGTRRSPRLS